MFMLPFLKYAQNLAPPPPPPPRRFLFSRYTLDPGGLAVFLFCFKFPGALNVHGGLTTTFLHESMHGVYVMVYSE